MSVTIWPAHAVIPNAPITAGTSTKITYDVKGLVTGGASATTADIADSTDARYCTDAQKTAIGTISAKATDSAVVHNTGAESMTGAKRGTASVLTSTGASIAIDLALSNVFTHTTSEDTTLSNPSNAVAVQAGHIIVTQGGTARTLAFGTQWKPISGVQPALTPTVGAVDVISYLVVDSTHILYSVAPGY
jgi:hypothetical protein